MNAATDWFETVQQRQSVPPRSYLSDIDVRVISREPAVSSTSAPQWGEKVFLRLRELLALNEGWDSYGARKPSLTSAAQLINVLSAVMASDTPAPSIVPSPHGHFQAEWHSNGVDLEVEVITPTKIIVSYEDAATDWDQELNVDFTQLIRAVRRVGRAR